jgi:hypothetical protein
MKSYLPRSIPWGAVCLLVLGFGGVAFAHGHGHPHPPGRAPELDPSLIIKGLPLLGGAAVMFLERFRRR